MTNYCVSFGFLSREASMLLFLTTYKYRTMKALITLLFMIALAVQAKAQIDILGKIEDKVEQKIDQKTDEAVDKALEDKEKTKESEKKEENSTEKSPTASSEAAFKSYSKFDFVPGDNVVFFDDFSQDAVGDFPAKWNSSGSGQLVTMNSLPGKWLKIDKYITFAPEAKISFPDNFTIEYDFVCEEDAQKTLGGFNTFLLSLENQEN